MWAIGKQSSSLTMLFFYLLAARKSGGRQVSRVPNYSSLLENKTLHNLNDATSERARAQLPRQQQFITLNLLLVGSRELVCNLKLHKSWSGSTFGRAPACLYSLLCLCDLFGPFRPKSYSILVCERGRLKNMAKRPLPMIMARAQL